MQTTGSNHRADTEMKAENADSTRNAGEARWTGPGTTATSETGAIGQVIATETEVTREGTGVGVPGGDEMTAIHAMTGMPNDGTTGTAGTASEGGMREMVIEIGSGTGIEGDDERNDDDDARLVMHLCSSSAARDSMRPFRRCLFRRWDAKLYMMNLSEPGGGTGYEDALLACCSWWNLSFSPALFLAIYEISRYRHGRMREPTSRPKNCTRVTRMALS
jgi:hypothetical protein